MTTRDFQPATLAQYVELGIQLREGRIDRDALARFLEAPDRYHKEIGRWGRIYPLTADCNISIDASIELANYARRNVDATAKNFPYQRKGQIFLNLELAEFDDEITGPEAEVELGKIDYQLEDSDVGFVFGWMFPIEQCRRPIIVGGKNSRWKDALVPYLSNVGSERRLDVCEFARPFAPCCQFLVSRKKAA